MYQKPEVSRFGTFRDLTQVGWSSSPSDGFTPLGPQSAGVGSPPQTGGGSAIARS